MCAYHGLHVPSRRQILVCAAAVAAAPPRVARAAESNVAPGPSTAVRSAAKPDLDGWLALHPSVAAAIVWEGERGAQAYPTWPAPWRKSLADAYDLAWRGLPTTAVEVPENLDKGANGTSWRTSIPEQDAFALFVDGVGSGLAVEIGRRVPWSILGYDGAQLAALFDGRSAFGRNNHPPIRYQLADGVPCRSSTALRFLADKGLVGADRLSTIAALLDWCRLLSHYTGAPHLENGEAHWGYRGVAPVSRVLAGTVFAGPGGAARGLRHYTAGCHGTVAMLRSVLGSVNIPVKRTTIYDRDEQGREEWHSTAVFMTEKLALSHADDPYSTYRRYDPTYPAKALLIGDETFARWFGRRPATTREGNVSRQASLLALDTLPLHLLNLHAEDLRKRRPPHESAVLAEFRRRYTLEDLVARTLWTRLDAAVAARGGPETVAALYRQARADYERRQGLP